jgi:N-glycosylase/DNA lyase
VDTYLVSIFKLAVVLTVLLDCVVGQVDKSVRHVFYVVVAAGGSQVALSVVVALQVSINSLSDGEQTNIEFAVFIQKRFLTVLLNNVTAFLSVNVRVRYNTLNLRKLLAHRDTAASIRVLTRLYNPDAVAHCGELR